MSDDDRSVVEGDVYFSAYGRHARELLQMHRENPDSESAKFMSRRVDEEMAQRQERKKSVVDHVSEAAKALVGGVASDMRDFMDQTRENYQQSVNRNLSPQQTKGVRVTSTGTTLRAVD